ncbi:MAG: hypothetical protein IJ523_01650 [Succinivibrionaceae bacterium]|nr:hypothetical protein [Succinivibrionaceae bacterium]
MKVDDVELLLATAVSKIENIAGDDYFEFTDGTMGCWQLGFSSFTAVSVKELNYLCVDDNRMVAKFSVNITARISIEKYDSVDKQSEYVSEKELHKEKICTLKANVCNGTVKDISIEFDDTVFNVDDDDLDFARS